LLKAKDAVQRIGLIGAGFVIALAVAEFVLRLGVLPATPFERVIQGGRTANPSRKILILGDSFLVHWETGKSLYELLVKGLEPEGAGILNTSEGGFGPLDYLTALRSYGPSYQPDVVLLFYYVGNDLTSIQYRSDVWLWIKRYLKPWIMRLRLYYFFLEREEGWLRGRLNYEAARKGGVDRRTVDLARQRKINPWLLELGQERKNFLLDNLLVESSESERAWEKIKGLLGETQGLCRKMGARLMIVILPNTLQVNRSHLEFYQRLAFHVDERTLISDKPQALLREFCREQQVPCLDLLPAFRAQREKEFFRENDDHFNRDGNELAARLVLHFIEKEAVLRKG